MEITDVQKRKKIPYQYQNRPTSYNNRYKPTKYENLRLKLNDLINPDRNGTFIDSLYAQFQSNSNQINLIYVPPNEKPPDNSVLLNNDLFGNEKIGNYSSTNQIITNSSIVDSNKLLNEFYLNAIKQKTNSK